MPTVTTASPMETRKLGASLGKSLARGDLVGLVGELGSGKTTFVQGLAHGWGSTDRVTSPTFILVNEYRRSDGELLFHLDAYRLESPQEAEDLDIDAFLTAGPLVVEWADRIQAVLPEPAYSLHFVDRGGDTREIVISRADNSEHHESARHPGTLSF